MLQRAVDVMVVGIVVMMVVATAGVGAALRIERRLDVGDVRVQTLDHLLDDVVAANADAVALELRGQVAVAEMPGDTEQFGRAVRRDLRQRLRRGVDGDDAPVIQRQPVAVAERDCLAPFIAKRRR